MLQISAERLECYDNYLNYLQTKAKARRCSPAPAGCPVLGARLLSFFLNPNDPGGEVRWYSCNRAARPPPGRSQRGSRAVPAALFAAPGGRRGGGASRPEVAPARGRADGRAGAGTGARRLTGGASDPTKRAGGPARLSPTHGAGPRRRRQQQQRLGLGAPRGRPSRERAGGRSERGGRRSGSQAGGAGRVRPASGAAPGPPPSARPARPRGAAPRARPPAAARAAPGAPGPRATAEEGAPQDGGYGPRGGRRAGTRGRGAAGGGLTAFLVSLGADLSLLQEDLPEDADGCECEPGGREAGRGRRGAQASAARGGRSGGAAAAEAGARRLVGGAGAAAGRARGAARRPEPRRGRRPGSGVRAAGSGGPGSAEAEGAARAGRARKHRPPFFGAKAGGLAGPSRASTLGFLGTVKFPSGGVLCFRKKQKV